MVSICIYTTQPYFCIAAAENLFTFVSTSSAHQEMVFILHFNKT